MPFVSQLYSEHVRVPIWVKLRLGRPAWIESALTQKAGNWCVSLWRKSAPGLGRIRLRHASFLLANERFLSLGLSTKAYEFNGKSALRSVELEIPMSPVKGSSSSKTRKIAPANDSAHTNSEIVTTVFGRANRVALTKIALSQNTIITRKGVGIELPACVNNCSRI